MQVVLITGALGGIGRALCTTFHQAGWVVVATDAPRHPTTGPHSAHPQGPWDHFFRWDLSELVRSPEKSALFHEQVTQVLPASKLHALVNNAAVQRLGSTSTLALEAWEESLRVNVTAPFLLTQLFLKPLESARGAVINVASIHARQTKPDFVAYATSKSALVGLTQAMAVDLGGRVRVNAISPAAISTPMLEAGFQQQPELRRQLDSFHPSGSIGQPEEVARLALFLADNSLPFLTGSCIGLDGAIAARLHDPA